MGCCNSKPEATLQEVHSPQTNSQVPPIVVTKAQSIASVESLPASTSANAVPIQQQQQEKSFTKIDSATEEEEEEEPPTFESTHPNAITLQDTKPVIISTSTNIPTDTKHTALNHQQPHNDTTWTILVRLSNSAVKDILVDIPTSAPFLTVSELKKKVPLESDQHIKLIHLGRILQDNFKLVPSSTSISMKSDLIKVSNRGVIQAMIYKL